MRYQSLHSTHSSVITASLSQWLSCLLSQRNQVIQCVYICTVSAAKWTLFIQQSFARRCISHFFFDYNYKKIIILTKPHPSLKINLLQYFCKNECRNDLKSNNQKKIFRVPQKESNPWPSRIPVRVHVLTTRIRVGTLWPLSYRGLMVSEDILFPSIWLEIISTLIFTLSKSSFHLSVLL